MPGYYCYVRHLPKRSATLTKGVLLPGVTRLLLFILLFVVLYTVTLIGVPSAERRAAEIVLSQALGLDEFSTVRTLPAFREGMVKFSHAMKEFSASG